MLRKFLTEQQKAELDDECRRYSEWRRSTRLGADDIFYEMLNSSESVNVTDGSSVNAARRSSVNAARVGSVRAGHGGGGVNAAHDSNLNANRGGKANVTRGSSVDATRGHGVSATQSGEANLNFESISSHDDGGDWAGFDDGGHVTFKAEAKAESGSGSGAAAAAAANQVTIDDEAAAAAAAFSEKLAKWKQNRILSVDEILAKGLREWREQKAKFRSSPFGKTKRLSTWAKKFSELREQNESLEHPVRNEIRREDEERKWQKELDKAAEESLDLESSTGSSTGGLFEATETESASLVEDDHVHRRKFWRNVTIATDIIKLLVYFCIFFFLVSGPLLRLPQPGPKDYVRYNLSEKNSCYFWGDSGLFNESNSCTYRGLMPLDWMERECLEWKDAIDGGKHLPGVGIEGIVYQHHRDHEDHRGNRNISKFRNFTNIKQELKIWREHYHNRDKQNLTETWKLAVVDYERRYCRRFPHNNAPVCLTLGDEGMKAPTEIYLTSCWINPCPLKLELECFKDIEKNKKAREELEKRKHQQERN